MQDRLTTGVLVSLLVGAAVALALAGCTGAPSLVPDARREALDQVGSFGKNPGDLNMYRYVPAGLPANAPLVVALHACTETAADFQAAGWNQVADAYQFYVVYAEQKVTNNSLRCFNWAGVTRGQGESESIKEMVDQMKADYSIDPARVFVAGFSAGGIEAINLLALYPDVFAGGGSLAAVPFDCATTFSDANACLSPGRVKSATDWGTLVRQGDPGFAGPWPRVVLWQGASDSVVAPANLPELVKQWTNVRGIDAVADATTTSGALTHAQYRDASGATLVDTFEVANLDHAVPVDPTHGCGVAGSYYPDVGICAAAQIATAFGLQPVKALPTIDLGTTPAVDGAIAPGSPDGGDPAAGPDDAATAPPGVDPVTPPAGGCSVAAAPCPASFWLVAALLAFRAYRRRARGAPASG